MSVRAAQLTFCEDSSHSDLKYEVERFGAIDILKDSPEVSRDAIAIQFIRHIMRDRHCSVIPEVIGLIGHPTNQWGDNFQIEVIYDRSWHAIYAGAVEDFNFRIVNISCYMD